MDNKIIYFGETRSGKTRDGIKRYNDLLKKGVDSNKILVFVLNRFQRSYFKKRVRYESISEENIYSYFGFIQRELKLYWPIILKKGHMIKKVDFLPTLMEFEASQSLISKTVGFFRGRGYLSELRISDEEIARKLLSNIVAASLSNFNYKKIGERVKKSKKPERRLSDKYYNELNEIINKYIERVLETGHVDQGLGIYLYTNYLLSDEKYLESLSKRYDYLIVDDLDLGSASLKELIGKLTPSLKGSYLYEGTYGGYGIYKYSMDSKNKDLIGYKRVKIGEEVYPLKYEIDILRKYIIEKVDKNILKEGDLQGDISLYLEDEYKGQSNKRILNLVDRLLKEGIKGEDISIIVPKYDITLDYGLSKISERYNERYIYTSREDRITDNPRISALITIGVIFYKYREFRLNYDEIKTFLRVILEIGPIESSILAEIIEKLGVFGSKIGKVEVDEKTRENIDKYNNIIDLLDELPRDLSIDKLFLKVYIEVLLNGSSDGDIRACKGIIDSSKGFLEVMSSFSVIKDPNYEFIKFIKDGAKTTNTLEEVEELVEGGYISLSTPVSFLNLRRRSKVIILGDIRSNLYLMNDENDLQNLWAFNKRWDEDEVLTPEIKDTLKRYESFGVISRIIRSGEKLHIFGSYGGKKGEDTYIGKGMLLLRGKQGRE